MLGISPFVSYVCCKFTYILKILKLNKGKPIYICTYVSSFLKPVLSAVSAWCVPWDRLTAQLQK